MSCETQTKPKARFFSSVPDAVQFIAFCFACWVVCRMLTYEAAKAAGYSGPFPLGEWGPQESVALILGFGLALCRLLARWSRLAREERAGVFTNRIWP